MTSILASKSETTNPGSFRPWNLGKLIGQKPPLKLREVWAIRIRLQIQGQLRELRTGKNKLLTTRQYA